MKYIAFWCLTTVTAVAQAQYTFQDSVRIACSEVKSQGNTGTCWSFTTASFLESEITRTTGHEIDLSEMYVVRQNYVDKAQNYILRQGKANFSEGSLSHDLVRIAMNDGLMPEQAYSGLKKDSVHDHQALVAELEAFLNGVLEAEKMDDDWLKKFNKILDQHLGKLPDDFIFEGEKHVSPLTFSKQFGLNFSEYKTYTSFTHHPLHTSFILEIPDNYSNGSYFNVTLDELVSICEAALRSGHSVAWDGDVSNAGFMAKKGIALVVDERDPKCLESGDCKENEASTEIRQKGFERLEITDDHLMHIVGMAYDQQGNRYFIVKNSWGPIGPYEGYLYMSEAYFRLYTIGIMVPEGVASKTLKTSQGH